MIRALGGIAAATVLLSGCLGDGIGVNRRAVFGAVTPGQILEMGGERLDGAAISAEFSGATLVEPNQGWVWQVGSDGSQHAHAKDNAWADAPGGTWEDRDGRFCRTNPDIAQRCSEVYKVGPYYRLTEDDGNLALWTVTQG